MVAERLFKEEGMEMIACTGEIMLDQLLWRQNDTINMQ